MITSEAVYKVPFSAATKALLEVLESCTELGLTWFDGDTSPETVHNSFKRQAEFAYGIFANSDAEVLDNTKSEVLWDFWLDLEIYSNYKGRLVVAQKLEVLLNYLSSDEGFGQLCTKLGDSGYKLLSIDAGKLHISLPIHGEYGLWQNGSVPLVLHLEQSSDSDYEEEVNNE